MKAQHDVVVLMSLFCGDTGSSFDTKNRSFTECAVIFQIINETIDSRSAVSLLLWAMCRRDLADHNRQVILRIVHGRR